MKWTRVVLAAAAALGIQSPAFAADDGPKQENFYMGGSVVSSSLDPFDDAMGYQFFGGYELPFTWASARHSIEVGYLDTGDFDVTIDILGVPVTTSGGSASGLWSTYNLGWAIADNVEVGGRLGLDFGDDDGVMLGAGVKVHFSSPLSLQFEVVQRQNIDSLIVNLVYRL